jgi:uroporphyrinogen decarboxylase
MSNASDERHLARAREVLGRLTDSPGMSRDGQAAFWARNDEALRDPFSRAVTHLPLGISMSDECVWDELSVAPAWGRFYREPDFHAELCRRYNDRAEQVVGRRLIGEPLSGDWDPAAPCVKTLADVFEAKNEWREETWSYWLHSSAGSPAELDGLLDRVERRLEDLRAFLLPPDWAERKERLRAGGVALPLYRHQRGPVTFAMSVFGAENLIYLILDDPARAARFRGLILRAILERARVMDGEAGFTPGDAPRGWSWADDNCALLTPEMYAFFASPIMQGVFDSYAPGPADRRYQHSDSAMGHLLPLLAELGLNEVNFGPTLSVTEIRRHLPRAIIHGQLAPMTLCRNDSPGIVSQTLRDFEESRAQRGVVFTTAGSVNPGSRLASLSLIMRVIQDCCRY